MKIHNWFPHPVYENMLDEDYDSSKLVPIILDKVNADPQKYLKGNWQCDVYTSFGFHEENRELFSGLYDVVEKRTNDFAKEIGVIQHQDETMVIREMWWNYYPENFWQEKHTHPYSSISGIIYLTNDEVPTVFYNPNLPLLHMDNHPSDLGNIYNRHSYDVFPQQNKLVMFRSYMDHAVKYVRQMERQYSPLRLTIAFNASMVKTDNLYHQ